MLHPSEENARILLSIAEQRRQYLSTAIDALNGLAITVTIGIWTLFLKSFLDASSPIQPPTNIQASQLFAILIVWAGLSTFILALWRLYARYIDNGIAKTYPEIMYYEQILGVGSDAGMENQIAGQKEFNREVFREVFAQLSSGQRQQLVRHLVKDRHIGRRGHLPIDFGVFVFLVILVPVLLFDIYFQCSNGLLGKLFSIPEIVNNPLLLLKWFGYVLMVVGWSIFIYAFFHFQRNPSKDRITCIADRIKAKSQDKIR